ncbi:MAG: HIT domain-containing protein [Firmicutes bacterium]|nr:HIT domain-containing protein [Bacillota bacterium]
MNDCLFCKIRDGIIPSEKLYEDDLMFIIKDIAPLARLHYLAIPKIHYKLLKDMTEQDALNLGKCFSKIAELADTLGLSNGFRIVINQGEDGAQAIYHLHIHILGGEKLSNKSVFEKT